MLMFVGRTVRVGATVFIVNPGGGSEDVVVGIVKKGVEVDCGRFAFGGLFIDVPVDV